MAVIVLAVHFIARDLAVTAGLLQKEELFFVVLARKAGVHNPWSEDKPVRLRLVFGE
jgi:hypothetical protein